MNKSLIIDQIKKLSLNGENYSVVIDEIADVNHIDQSVSKKYIDELLKDGVLVNTSKKKISLSESVGLKRGLVQINKNGTGFLLVENGEDILIPKSELKSAASGDEVWVQCDYESGKYLTRGKVKSIIKHSTTKFVGTIDILSSVAFVKPDRFNVPKDVIVPLGKTLGAKSGDKVYCDITEWKENEIRGVVIEVLGKADEVDTDVLCIVRNYDLREEFPPFVLDNAKKFPSVVLENEYENRRDLRNDVIFTIDGIDTRDIDDAITLSMNQDGTYHLGVHIADVGHYVPQNSILDREAFVRGTSVYFPNNVFPMLPRELSNGICSLNEGVDRLTLSCVMDIDSNGEVVNHEIFESVIRSCHKMNYDDCNKILKGDKELAEKYSDITPMLFKMQELMLILEKRRDKLGAIVFDVPELQIILNDKNEIETFKAKPHDIAERIIESFMISANETVARHFKKLKVPFVYRIHDKPDSQKVDAFKDFISGFGVDFKCNSENLSSGEIQRFLEFLKDKPYNQVANKVLLRSMSKAKYSPEPLGHYALALKDYTHFTSPIRRYCDLTIHRIIKKCLHGEITGQYKKQLEMFVADSAMRASTTEVTADKCEREVDDYFKARYMRNKIGEEFTGTVNGTIDSGIFVELDNTVEGFISVNDLPGYGYSHDENRHLLTNGNNTYQMGDKVDIVVDSVDLFKRRVNFTLKNYKKITDNDIKSLFDGDYKRDYRKNTNNNKKKSKKNKSKDKNSFNAHKTGKKSKKGRK